MTKRYNTFTMTRPGYWGLWIGLYVLQQIMAVGVETIPSYANIAWYYGYALGFFATCIAGLVIIAARCRDAGLNGWWCLAGIIPFAMIYFGCIRPDDHPKKIRAIEKLRVNESDLLDLPDHDAPKAPEDEHSLIDIPNSKE